MNQTRRQFFKTIAATAAGVVAVGVAPRVVKRSGWKNRVEGVLINPNPAQAMILDEFAKKPSVGESTSWASYYADHDDAIDATLLAKLDAAVKVTPFRVPLGGWI